MSMSNNRKNETTHTAQAAPAQSATAVLEEDVPTTNTPNATEPKKPLVERKADPTDVQWFLDNMRVSDEDANGQEPYKWKNKADSAFWKVVWFPVSRYHALKDALLSRGVVLVEKTGSILTRPFSGEDGIFEDSSFDVSGRVHSKFVAKNEQLGTYEPEMWMCLQPIAAHQAMQQRMVERVKNLTERKAESRTAEERATLYKVAQDSGVRKGAVQISNHEGYDDL